MGTGFLVCQSGESAIESDQLILAHVIICAVMPPVGQISDLP